MGKGDQGMKKLFAALVCSVGLLLVLTVQPTSAQTGDCDDNAVVRCGAFSVSELQTKMTGDVPAIYAHYGINTADFSSLTTGTVRSDGTVWANGRQVASQAISVGRQDMPGSTAVSGLGVYERPPSVSFASNELSAFIKMTNGQFVYAIIQVCGNPVKATPVAAPQQPQATQHPSVSISKTVNKASVGLNEQFTYSVTVRNSGDQALTNAVITDTPPAAVQFVPGASGVTERQFTTTIVSLPVGGSQTFTINAKVISQTADQIINTACVNAPEIPGDRDACASVAVQLPPTVTPAVSTTTPTVTPAVVVREVAAPAPSKLPATGASTVLGLGAGTTVTAYFGSLLYGRLRRRFLA
ncbi:MAG TPA: DUF11 domain-containing protein [Candidatus Limnocylindrales bacterium]|nr:DUF11 domain-containing protein [Candidatus Limnocylindrales bacterium]